MSNPLDTPWRPSLEAYSAAVWTGTATLVIFKGATSGPHITVALVMSMVSIAFAAFRWTQAFMLWEQKLSLLPEAMAFVTPEALTKMVRKDPQRLWMGRGFIWSMKHTQLAFMLRKADADEVEPPHWYARLRGYNPQADQIGATWIHGLETTESNIRVPISHFDGHVLICGTTGSGKTRALDCLITQAVIRGDTVIIIDPKGDKDLRQTAQRACILAGAPEKFMHFHPAHPAYSVRIDPLRNWNRATEVPSRITQLLQSDAESNAFVDFSWMTLNNITQGLVYVNERPNLKSLRRHIEIGPELLLSRVLEKFYEENIPNWRSRIVQGQYKQQAKNVKRQSNLATDDLVAMVLMWKNEISSQFANNKAAAAVGGLVSMFDHSREHAGKMIASLKPILEMLTSDDVGELLSPDPSVIEDRRPVIDSSKVINEGLVLYLGLDGLSDMRVGSAIGSIMLSDLCAVAGDRYNYGVNNSRRVSLFIDEGSDVINDATISLLNKSRGANFQLTIATQTYPDFIARTGSEPKARKILGNINNLVALRTKDGQTQEYITETFGSASVMTTMISSATTAVVGDRDPTNFTANYGERMVEDNDAELFSADLLGQLPNLHYVASVSGGKIYKGRFPILRSHIKPSLEEMVWLQQPGELINANIRSIVPPQQETST